MSYTEEVLERLEREHAHRPTFRQAVHEVVADLEPLLEARSVYRRHRVLERILLPDRSIGFRVTWEDDDQQVQVQQAWRIQHLGVLGPYKGGLRFHRSVNDDILGFLAFEQVFKNALTGQNLGGAKGGSDFDPKGRSDSEIRRFCHALMGELHRHIGPRTDVPAGDIGVGVREIGYLYGAYRRTENRFEGVLTGKGVGWGGSRLRTEATGFGLVYLVEDLLQDQDRSLDGLRVAISGAGNVALHAARKVVELGGRVVTLSDSRGALVAEDGLTFEQLDAIEAHKQSGGSLGEVADDVDGAVHHDTDAGRIHWRQPVDVALPCATQNELDEDDAAALVECGVRVVAEGANMPCTAEAVRTLREAGVTYVPGKAANAGGVAVSGLEMAQNAAMEHWSSDKVDRRLKALMRDILDRMASAAERWGVPGDLAAGANLAGFERVADALVSQGY